MTIEILMPALSPTMTEGTLASWQKKEGDTISAGDVICEIETDKATMEVEAVDEGVLGKILVEAGTEGVAVNAPIAILLEEGEDKSALDGAVAKAGKGGDAPAPAPAAPEPAKAAPAASPAPAPASGGGVALQEGSKAPAAPKSGSGERIFASPLARRIAAQEGLDLAAVSGSGPRGRIVKSDVEAALKSGGAKPAAQQAATADKPATAAPAAAPAPDRPPLPS